jgi:RHS repeat-associated protein
LAVVLAIKVYQIQPGAARDGDGVADALGSMRQLADASSAVSLAQSYEPYGSVLSSMGAGTTSYGFTGEWTSSQTGLIDLRAREYSPAVGRFISKDNWSGGYINLVKPGAGYDGSDTSQFSTGDWPADYARPQSLNGWAYTEGNPVNCTDPKGHFVCGFGWYWDNESKTCKRSAIGGWLIGLLPPWVATVTLQSSGAPGFGDIIETTILRGVCALAIKQLIHTVIQTLFQSVTILYAWETRKTSTWETVRVRPLSDSEVSQRGATSRKSASGLWGN